ncbi:hypothetical protein [Mucilaginibacter aquariorum]|uniref:Uncharacterized protein n=1 Tax=Mucilaginibacter aquariorum TaxID=2967225 RepID=A0ABT1T662_9SPHI|nr:hypothetical protein [Mucilaginibacter aquariorum]MCQ6960072.1 hypothetical protein [Mucilaginibacter aquariorum]
MTFEEFFNKKRIDLVALKAGEPGLFAEFEKHFTQMGEKSFDHTKKYWFNKLRLQYHLAPEQKPEKIHLENKLAEQTIVETLTDTIPAPSVGFKPRFKAGMAAKPAETSNIKDPLPKDSATATPEVNEAAATKDQNPEFEQEKAAMQDIADATPRTTDDSEEKKAEPSAPKPGFKPRFNMKMTQGEAPQTKEFEKAPEPEKEAAEPTSSTETVAPKPSFKPRFNMKAMAAPKPTETEEAKPETVPVKEETEPTPSPETTTPKPAGFKPRFNMKTMAPKPAEDVVEKKEDVEQPRAEAKPEDAVEPTPPEEAPAPKIGFKPRFNAKTMKPKPPEE